eukprot:CAMPEP_0119052096 /NCGR_PEP_ID=MMETSP1177-20130426/73509_1 /TAXON_ID=2985 /ORGANISM="Ochromonas sp, Strain CCMP1899" /LENGTH=165 /DNA_ID=CAMNT_0007031551 /DNA_START=332 /DNA_END=829 /DNA_ORIENTATION=-
MALEAVAEGAFNLANVIHRQKGDLIKAEELARESLRIRTLIYGINYHSVGLSCKLMAIILETQGNLGDETRGFYERHLAIAIRDSGPDGLNTPVGSFQIGAFYYKLARAQTTVDLEQKQLLLAKSHIEEALRIYSKIHGPTHPDTLKTASLFTNISSELSQISPN